MRKTRRKTTQAGMIQNVPAEWLEGGVTENTEAAGDPLVKISEGDVMLRARFQNTEGTGLNSGFATTLYLEAIDEVDTDIGDAKD